jgi:hypothetical protein
MAQRAFGVPPGQVSEESMMDRFAGMSADVYGDGTMRVRSFSFMVWASIGRCGARLSRSSWRSVRGGA